MTNFLKNMKNACMCKPFNWVLMVVLIIYLIVLIGNWKAPSLEFIPNQGLLKHQYNRLGNESTEANLNQLGGGNKFEQLGGATEFNQLGGAGALEINGISGTSSGLKSITQDPNLFLNPNGGDNLCHVLGSAPGNFQCQFADPTLCSLSREDQASLAIAIKTGACFRGKNPTQTGSGLYGKTIDPARIAKPGCLPCRARDDLNYVSQTGSGITNNNILYPMDPRNSNQSELYSQFYRDVQNQLSEHSVQNYRFPSWSTLTSSYRNDPQYCGIGDTVNEFISNDHCFDPVEYQSTQQIKAGGAIKDVPSVINTQIANKNRRLRSQIVYTPVKTVDEIVPFNGILNEKPSNFTSERTRTFDWFTHASLGHVDALI